MMVNIFALVGVETWAADLAPHKQSATHQIRMQWRGGSVTFVPSFLAQYLNWGMWLHGSLVIGWLLMLWWYEKKTRAVRLS
jgi:hypothetical protein